MLPRYITSALLLASLSGCLSSEDTVRQSGWYSLDGQRGDCGSITYGPNKNDKITTPNRGECAFDALAKEITLDKRGLSDAAKPRVNASRGYYDNYEILKYDFDYALAKPEFYGSADEHVGEYLTNIKDWNPNLNCEILRDNKNAIYALNCDQGRIKVTSYGAKYHKDQYDNDYWLLNIKQTLP